MNASRSARDSRWYWVAGLAALLFLLTGAWWVNTEPQEHVQLAGQGTSVLAYPASSSTEPMRLGLMQTTGASAPAQKKLCEVESSAHADASLLTRLSELPGEQARAVAMLLRMISMRREDSNEFQLQWQPCDADYVPEFKTMSAAQCADRKRLAKERAQIIYQRSIAEPLKQLTAMATQTTDPAVYAQALAACNIGRMYATPSAATCSQLSLTRWAQLDPDNMEPWLQLANQATQRNDEVAWLDAAMRAAQAKRRQNYREMPALQIAEVVAANSSDEEWQTAAFQTETLLTLTVQQWRDPWAWLGPCSSAKVADGNRRQVCEALLHGIRRNTASWTDSLEATMLAKNLGWSQEKVKAIHRETSILQHLALRAYVDWNTETGEPIPDPEDGQAPCNLLRARAQRKLRFMGMSEVDIGRLQLKESGQTMTQAEAEMQ